MKKTILLLAIIVVTGSSLLAQKSSLGYNQGDKLLNIGVGVNSYYSGGIPLGASFELGITDVISVGGNVDYLSNTYYNVKFTAIYFGGRGSYHFNELLNLNNEKIDLYAGAGVGFRSFRWSDGVYDYGSAYGNGIYVGAFAGGKYYFSEKIGAFAELGATGSTNARIGIGFKF